MELNKLKQEPLELKYGGKKYQIDIDRELAIDNGKLNSQIEDIPKNYFFLCMVRDRYVHKKNVLEYEMNRAFSEAWVYYKEADSRINNDLATHKASTNKKYLSVRSKYLKALDKANKYISICKAYETRERMVQTLSSNLRKQNT